ncbi:hypothetical protein U5801_21395 [Lamprobacter modestohalophilus]|uniref:hypothetical protein n=1 Tax=Lamprobacter modestohalophilus TaxID=1064514 RepID=UPI002ADEAA1B|nr:hypothetical protein [Lamprobacter modestohalophilus]MEA1052340.1 hypothetical protein [Lamprobacter modestohalophilus]
MKPPTNAQRATNQRHNPMFIDGGIQGTVMLCSVGNREEIYGIGNSEEAARENAINNAFVIDADGESHPVTQAWIDEQLTLGRQSHAGALMFAYDDEDAESSPRHP